MIEVRFLIIISLLISACGLATAQKNTIPYLTKGDFAKINNKTEKQINLGCFVEQTTEGAFELDKILRDSLYFNTIRNKQLLCISIIKNAKLYHLHDLAGYNLSLLLKNEDNYEFLKENTDAFSFNYCLIRINHVNDSILRNSHFFELDSMKQLGLIIFIKDKRLNNSSKKYIIDCLYSLVFKNSTGNFIHDKIGELDIDKELLSYNDDIFTTYKKVKYRFEMLDNIETWMEMDKKYDDIKAMLVEFQPMMFYQILSFNPSTVLNSKELCKLKKKAISDILKKAQKGSFYNDMKFAYLNELLFEDNYTLKYLD